MKALLQERPRVLIVDDQPNWLKTLQKVLDSTLYDVETASTYDQAREKLKRRAFHVLVTDQRLVDEDETNRQGLLLLDEVEELRDGTKTIVVTGYPTVEAAKEAIKGRHAYDYLLKRPEEGGAFRISEYRDQVREAARQAMHSRQKETTLGFSLSGLVSNLSFEQIVEAVFAGGPTPDDAVSGVRAVLNRLLYPLQPFAPRMGRAWLSDIDQTCEILCWSRRYGQAVIVKIGRGQSALELDGVNWIDEGWYPIKERDRFVSSPFAGRSCVLERMAFEDLEAFVEEE